MNNYFEELSNDIDNYELPENSDNYDKIDGELIIGKRFYWYYKEDLELYEGENIKDYLCNLFSGICIPRPNIEYRGGELNIEDTVIVCNCQPVEKDYPEVYWITLGRLLNNDDLVEFFENPILS
jgi:hypothetical protein